MKSKFALMAVLWLAIGGTVVATARPETPIIKIPPTLDETEARLQRLESLVNQQQVQIQSLRSENQTLRSDLANMVAINDYVTLTSVHGRPTVRFKAVNVQVVNGAGANASNGLGNILIGYDQLRNGDEGLHAPECSRGTGIGSAITESVSTEAECLAVGGTWQLNHKSGSHYLVVGDHHNYSSWAGIVAGGANTSNSANANVTGGLYNQATGYGASVSGGARNRASGYMSSVIGGLGNTASGQNSSVSGGLSSIASGPEASVTGGASNKASGPYSTVNGGSSNSSAGAASAIGGGAGNTASGYGSSISGGRSHKVPNDFGWAAGGN